MLFNIGEDEYNCISQNLMKLYLLKYKNEKYNCKIQNIIVEESDDYDYEYSNNVNANFNEDLFNCMNIDLEFMDINKDSAELLNINRQFLIFQRHFIEYEYEEYNLKYIDQEDLDSIFSSFFIKTVVFSNKYINTVINKGLFNNKFREQLNNLNQEFKIIYEINAGTPCCELDCIKIKCDKNLGVYCYLPTYFTPTIELIDCFMELIKISKYILKNNSIDLGE